MALSEYNAIYCSAIAFIVFTLQKIKQCIVLFWGTLVLVYYYSAQYKILIGFLHFRPPKIYARKITTLENPPKAQNLFPTKISATGHE